MIRIAAALSLLCYLLPRVTLSIEDANAVDQSQITSKRHSASPLKLRRALSLPSHFDHTSARARRTHDRLEILGYRKAIDGVWPRRVLDRILGTTRHHQPVFIGIAGTLLNDITKELSHAHAATEALAECSVRSARIVDHLMLTEDRRPPCTTDDIVMFWPTASASRMKRLEQQRQVLRGALGSAGRMM